MGGVLNEGRRVFRNIGRSVFSGDTGAVLRDPRFWIGAALASATGNAETLQKLANSIFLFRMQEGVREKEREAERAFRKALEEERARREKELLEERIKGQKELLERRLEEERKRREEERQTEKGQLADEIQRRREAFLRFYKGLQEGRIDPDALADLYAVDPKLATSLLTKVQRDEKIDPLDKWVTTQAMNYATKMSITPEEIPENFRKIYSIMRQSIEGKGENIPFPSSKEPSRETGKADELVKKLLSMPSPYEKYLKEKPGMEFIPPRLHSRPLEQWSPLIEKNLGLGGK